MTKKVLLPTDRTDEQESPQKKFEERSAELTGQLSQMCDSMPVAVALLIDPEHADTPIVFTKGHVFEQAELLAAYLRKLQRQILPRIGIDT